MKRTRTLSLTREALTPLSTGELGDVVGAADAVPTTPVKVCLEDSNFVCTGDCWTRGTTCTC